QILHRSPVGGDIELFGVERLSEVAEPQHHRDVAALVVARGVDLDDLEFATLSRDGSRECHHHGQEEAEEKTELFHRAIDISPPRRAKGSGSNRSEGRRMPWAARSSEKDGRIPVALSRPL